MKFTLFEKTIVLVIFSGITSIVIGLMYIFRFWITFRILGNEIGSESTITGLWAAFSISLGVALLLSLIKAAVRIKQVTKKYEFDLSLLFTSFLLVIQLPPLVLWGLFCFSDRQYDHYIGLSTHVFVLILLLATVYAIIRKNRSAKDH